MSQQRWRWYLLFWIGVVVFIEVLLLLLSVPDGERTAQTFPFWKLYTWGFWILALGFLGLHFLPGSEPPKKISISLPLRLIIVCGVGLLFGVLADGFWGLIVYRSWMPKGSRWVIDWWSGIMLGVLLGFIWLIVIAWEGVALIGWENGRLIVASTKIKLPELPAYSQPVVAASTQTAISSQKKRMSRWFGVMCLGIILLLTGFGLRLQNDSDVITIGGWIVFVGLFLVIVAGIGLSMHPEKTVPSTTFSGDIATRSAASGDGLYLFTLLFDAWAGLFRAGKIIWSGLIVLLPILVVAFLYMVYKYLSAPLYFDFRGTVGSMALWLGVYLFGVLVWSLYRGFGPLLRSISTWTGGGSITTEELQFNEGARPIAKTMKEFPTIIAAHAQLMADVEPDEWAIIESPVVNSYTIGRTIFLTRAAIASPFLPALMAHELGHLAQGDGLKLLAIRRLATNTVYELGIDRQAESIGSLAGGQGPTVVSEENERLYFAMQAHKIREELGWLYGGIGYLFCWPRWADFWRSQDFGADAYAAKLGMKELLIQCLEKHQMLDVAQPYRLSARPYAAERIEKLDSITAQGIEPQGVPSTKQEMPPHSSVPRTAPEVRWQPSPWLGLLLLCFLGFLLIGAIGGGLYWWSTADKRAIDKKIEEGLVSSFNNSGGSYYLSLPLDFKVKMESQLTDSARADVVVFAKKEEYNNPSPFESVFSLEKTNDQWQVVSATTFLNPFQATWFAASEQTDNKCVITHQPFFRPNERPCVQIMNNGHFDWTFDTTQFLAEGGKGTTIAGSSCPNGTLELNADSTLDCFFPQLEASTLIPADSKEFKLVGTEKLTGVDYFIHLLKQTDRNFVIGELQLQ